MGVTSGTRLRSSVIDLPDAPRAPDPSEDESSLGQILRGLEEEGYGGQMGARPGGRLRCFACRVVNSASKVTVDELRRAEGASDPDDMVAVAAVTCPNCRTRATVVLGYGPEASEDDTEVLLHLGGSPTGTGTA